MQVDPARIALYKKEAPELLQAVTSGEAEHIMRRDPVTDYCVKFDNGLCSIHKARGTNFLGDACHFYPRITRRFGEAHLQSASLSCPEITRLILYGVAPFAPDELSLERLPSTLNNYLPEEITATDAFAVQRAFLEIGDDETITAERMLMRIVSTAHSLHRIAKKDWIGGIKFILRMSESTLPNPEIDFADGYHLMQVLEALIGASKPSVRPRLDATRQSILQALDIKITADNYEVVTQSGDFTTYQKLWERWQESRPQMAPILKRWLQAQITMSSFPFSGFGRDLQERAVTLAIRFATLRLALMSAPSLEQSEVIRIVQSFSRFIDHLADPELSMLAYKELGWTSLARLRGVVLDI